MALITFVSDQLLIAPRCRRFTAFMAENRRSFLIEVKPKLSPAAPRQPLTCTLYNIK
jgi:hypothetical protein